MTRVGCLWVGPLEHNADFQRDILAKRGVDQVFEDMSAHSATPTRPQLTSALETIGQGETLLVWRLDRLGGTSPNVLSLLELLGRRGVGVSSIAENLDTSGMPEARPAFGHAAFLGLPPISPNPANRISWTLNDETERWHMSEAR